MGAIRPKAKESLIRLADVSVISKETCAGPRCDGIVTICAPEYLRTQNFEVSSRTLCSRCEAKQFGVDLDPCLEDSFPLSRRPCAYPDCKCEVTITVAEQVFSRKYKFEPRDLCVRCWDPKDEVCAGGER